MTLSLTKLQKRHLKRLAHHLRPYGLVGKGGVSDAFIGELVHVLQRHELVKVKFNEFKERKAELVEVLCEKLGAGHVATVGNVAIIFKPHPDPEKQKFRNVV